MTTPELGPATGTIAATVEVPVTDEDFYLHEDADRDRLFAVDTITLRYAQEYTGAGTADETLGPWDVTAVMRGPIVTGGVKGKRTTRKTVYDVLTAETETRPPWLGPWLVDVAQRYQPLKRT